MREWISSEPTKKLVQNRLSYSRLSISPPQNKVHLNAVDAWFTQDGEHYCRLLQSTMTTPILVPPLPTCLFFFLFSFLSSLVSSLIFTMHTPFLFIIFPTDPSDFLPSSFLYFHLSYSRTHRLGFISSLFSATQADQSTAVRCFVTKSRIYLFKCGQAQMKRDMGQYERQQMRLL